MEWTAMVALGAYHGINPGMGWLFAVALGLQEGSGRAVVRALPPIAIGHALAAGVVLAAAAAAQAIVPGRTLRVMVASALLALGVYRLWRHRHPRYGGMRVGFRDLVVWSFLMGSAHGAGLMLLPFVVGMPGDALAASSGHAAHAAHAASAAAATNGLALATHTAAYLVVMAGAALVVYYKLGLALLRTAWFNLDWLWAGALVLAGIVVLIG